MDAWLMWTGRIYPAVGLLLVGLGMVLTGLNSGLVRTRGRTRSWPEWALVYLYVFRRVVIGVCLVALGVGWLNQVPWLFAVSACVGLGELLESSYYIGVLHWAQRRGSLPRLQP